MIDWDKIGADLGDLETFGFEVLTIYQNVVVSGKPDEELTPVESVALSAGERSAQQANLDLEEIYRQGSYPRMAVDWSRLAANFAIEVVRRFHRPICVELKENKDIVLLAPTIITLMNLEVGLAAFAVPISAIISRIGIGTLCGGIEADMEDDEFIGKRIRLHESNLSYLEEERSRYLPNKPPAALAKAIVHEEELIARLRSRSGKV